MKQSKLDPVGDLREAIANDTDLTDMTAQLVQAFSEADPDVVTAAITSLDPKAMKKVENNI